MNAPVNAPPFPTNPAVGEWFGNWVWNGVRWVCSPSTGLRVIMQTFTQSGPYMPSPGLTSVQVECIGGGGGGGAAISPGNNAVFGGGGGGSGSSSRIVLAAAIVAGGVSVTIGEGGTGSDGAGAGTFGGSTTFGALCIANGGAKGDDNSNSGYGFGGAPGNPGVGTVAFAGAAGFNGIREYPGAGEEMAARGGIGGSIVGGTSWGGDASPGEAVDAGGGWDGTGAGGNGGIVNQIASGTAKGGNGGSGICIVTEYCFGSGEDDCLNPPVNVNAKVMQVPYCPPWPGPGPCPPNWPGYGPYEE